MSTRQDNYYCTGAFIVDAFSEYNHTLCRILEACKSRFRDLAAKRVRPVKQLVGFTKIPLEPGEFDIFAGGNSRDCLNVRFTL